MNKSNVGVDCPFINTFKFSHIKITKFASKPAITAVITLAILTNWLWNHLEQRSGSVEAKMT